eukprot:2084471-Pyramimonas_sp.AAC.1
MLLSSTAIPFVEDLSQVRDAPWRPHVGLHVTMRSSGLQLVTRVLDLPRKLPQVARPTARPVE